MRVLFTNEAPLIKYGLAEGFKQIGHEVRVIQGENERLWGGHSPEEQEARLKRVIDEFKPDLVFTEGYAGCQPNRIMNVPRKMGIPIFYWAIEDPSLNKGISMQYAPYADYVFTTAIECVEEYKKIGRPSAVLLFGCNPEFHRKVKPKKQYQHDIVLVANNYSSRYDKAQWFVRPIVEAGYDIKIWGQWWDDPSRPVNLLDHMEVYGGILPYEELPSVYSSAKIILGMNCDDTSSTQTSMRPYEALACGGGLFLAHYTKAQENLFGDLIFQAKSTEETLALIDRILSMDKEERKERARRAQKEVYEKHSYASRAQQIVEVYERAYCS